MISCNEVKTPNWYSEILRFFIPLLLNRRTETWSTCFRGSGMNMTQYFLWKENPNTPSASQCGVGTPQSAGLSNIGFLSESVSVIFYSQLSQPKIKHHSNFRFQHDASLSREGNHTLLVLQRTSIWLMQLENPVIMPHPSTQAQNIGLPAWNYHVNVCKSQAFYIDLDNWLQPCDLRSRKPWFVSST